MHRHTRANEAIITRLDALIEMTTRKSTEKYDSSSLSCVSSGATVPVKKISHLRMILVIIIYYSR